MQQLLLFEKRLPAHTRATDALGSPCPFLPRADAILRRYVAPNPPKALLNLVYDLDRSTAAFDWEDLRAPAPSFLAVNPANGHAHGFYALEIPVLKDPERNLRPLAFCADVQFALREQLQADRAYNGPLAKNPLHPDWITIPGQVDPYTLDWLADYLPMEKVRERRLLVPVFGVGRNVDLFNATRQWAYRHRFQSWTFESWRTAVLEQAADHNRFEAPLPLSEVRSVARSVARWTWERLPERRRYFLARQSARGKQGALVSALIRGQKAQERLQRILPFSELSSGQVAERTGIPARTIRRLRSSPLAISPIQDVWGILR